MKLRVHGDSVRLRLSQAEVAQLAETGVVESATHVAPGAALAVMLRAEDIRQPTASLDGSALTVAVSRADVAVWAEDDREGLYGEQSAGDGRTLQVAVEKDYACDHRETGAHDTFPRPDA